jgi:hypothetical protein
VNAALFKLAAERIKAHYQKANPGLLPVGTLCGFVDTSVGVSSLYT